MRTIFDIDEEIRDLLFKMLTDEWTTDDQAAFDALKVERARRMRLLRALGR